MEPKLSLTFFLCLIRETPFLNGKNYGMVFDVGSRNENRPRQEA